ncbi:Serine/threonine-protein kinase PknD [Cereibacter sphaeroides KD131]|nr:Serine/threonine-protein kinase PknD [Cereibacter sphaeroides KD131]
MFRVGSIPADVRERQAERRDFGTDERKFIGAIIRAEATLPIASSRTATSVVMICRERAPTAP